MSRISPESLDVLRQHTERLRKAKGWPSDFAEQSDFLPIATPYADQVPMRDNLYRVLGKVASREWIDKRFRARNRIPF